MIWLGILIGVVLAVFLAGIAVITWVGLEIFMIPMTPEKLVEKIMKVKKRSCRCDDCINDVRDMLCIVLKAIEDGKIVEGQCAEDGKCVGLTPSFAEFMKEGSK